MLSNEKLRGAMRAAAIDPDQLAEHVGVDAKTIGRWLAGRTPYPRHRTLVAELLGVQPHQLWPDADLPPARTEPDGGELVAVYTRADDPGAPDGRTLLEAAVGEIDLLDFTLADLLHDPEIIRLLAAKTAGGCHIRILVSAPDSAYLAVTAGEQAQPAKLTVLPQMAFDAERTIGFLQPLLAAGAVEARTFVAGRFNSIVRCDGRMLVTLHLWGTEPRHAPLLHLQRHGDDGIFDRFAAHYDAIWHEAATALQADPGTYPDPDHNPERYQPPTPPPGALSG